MIKRCTWESLGVVGHCIMRIIMLPFVYSSCSSNTYFFIAINKNVPGVHCASLLTGVICLMLPFNLHNSLMCSGGR
ncbi:hypothetical protein BGZ63DRAFT_372487 [Mariannaea sp. PMI_226]|nr:hypothetical protein BGZ63DRAFT_372487 [Mariannaea sp. PMI_226]